MASAEEKDFDDINVTPMVDLYLVLLLIFIIMTTAGVQGLKVNLPSASSKPATAKLDAPKTQAVTIDSSGNIKLNAMPVSLADLESQLGSMIAAEPDTPVVVRGDRANQYQIIMDVLDVLGRVGVSQIALATQPGR
jgi:biopolymer transport protein ExbD